VELAVWNFRDGGRFDVANPNFSTLYVLAVFMPPDQHFFFNANSLPPFHGRSSVAASRSCCTTALILSWLAKKGIG
jgi:hypothetical protein